VFNQVKTVSTATLCTGTGTKSSVSLQLSKNMVKQSCCTHPVQYSKSFGICFRSDSFSNFWSFRCLGKEKRDAFKKSLSTFAGDGRVAFSLRKRSLMGGKPLRDSFCMVFQHRCFTF